MEEIFSERPFGFFLPPIRLEIRGPCCLPEVDAPDGTGGSERSGPWFVLRLPSNHRVVTDTLAWEVEDMLALVVWLRVENPPSRDDLVGGAAAGEVTEIKVGRVAVQS